jgi:hypothetical protein
MQNNISGYMTVWLQGCEDLMTDQHSAGKNHLYQGKNKVQNCIYGTFEY